ncbi:MAG: hypothetical protein ACLRX4_08095 [Oscillospiraceae bacterium]
MASSRPTIPSAFESDTARWTYKIDAVLGSIMDKTYDKIVSLHPSSSAWKKQSRSP